MKSSKMTVRTKLIICFGLSILLTMITGGIGLQSITNSNTRIQDLVYNDVVFLQHANSLERMALTHRRYEKDFFLNIGKPEKQKKYLEKFTAISQKTHETISIMNRYLKTKTSISKQVGAAMTSVSRSHSIYVDNFGKLSTILLQDDSITPQQGNKMMKPFKDQIYTFEKQVHFLKKSANKWIAESGTDIIASGKNASLLITILFPVAFILGTGIAFFLTQNIMKILGCDPAELNIITSRIANGDLTSNISGKNGKEPMGVYKNMGLMCEKLQEIFKNIKTGTNTLSQSSSDLSTVSTQMLVGSEDSSNKANAVAAASEEMSANMASIAAASEETSVNVNMVASATEEMSSTITEIVMNTNKTKSITDTAVKQSATASERINNLGRAANEIGKVTETITEISEQTNLLALNATIEAARAGESGKGFAVVANEIKDLAKQTSEATTQIKEKITGIQEASNLSVADINQIAKVIQEISEMIASIAVTVEEQSNATQEIASNISQASEGIQEVNQNVAEASSVTGEISGDISSVSQVASELTTASKQVNVSAMNLNKLSANLASMVDQFKV